MIVLFLLIYRLRCKFKTFAGLRKNIEERAIKPYMATLPEGGKGFPMKRLSMKLAKYTLYTGDPRYMLRKDTGLHTEWVSQKWPLRWLVAKVRYKNETITVLTLGGVTGLPCGAEEYSHSFIQKPQ